MRRLRAPLLLTLALAGCGRDLALPSGDRPPQLALAAPCRSGGAGCQDNALVSGDVTVQVARTGGGQVSAIELWTPGIEVQKLDAPPWTWTIHSKALYPVGGVMPVYVTAIDTGGVRASPVQYSFIVDNAGPDLAVAAPTHDTSWPMTLPVQVSVCAGDVSDVSSVRASAGQAQGDLLADGTCPDGRARFSGSVPAPGGGENTLPFDLTVEASDTRGNRSSTTVPLTATRARWSRVIRSPAAFFGGATAPVPQTVQHAFRAYQGGLVMQTSNTSSGYVFWLPFDGSAPAQLVPDLTRYAFSPYQDGAVATLITPSGTASSINAYLPVAGVPTLAFSNSDADWGGVGELAGFGDQVACFANDQNNVNPLFKRLACIDRSGARRLSYQLNQLTFDIAGLAVAGDVVLVLREPSSACGLQLDRYSPAGVLLASSPCLYTRPAHPYVHADAYGAVVTTSFLAAQVDTAGAVTDLTSKVSGLGALLARGPGGRLLWVLNDATQLGTVVTVTDAGGTSLGRTNLPFRASAPVGFSPAGGFDAFYSDAAAFDDTGQAYAALLETTLNGPIFHVVSVDAAGQLRWQYVTGALLSLSLSPSRTAEPVYLLHDDGTVDALVR